MPKLKDGCLKPARGPIAAETSQEKGSELGFIQEVTKVLARVGQRAIDFEASAFIAGEGFRTVKLSDYAGRWIVICFYPGDFTYV